MFNFYRLHRYFFPKALLYEKKRRKKIHPYFPINILLKNITFTFFSNSLFSKSIIFSYFLGMNNIHLPYFK